MRFRGGLAVSLFAACGSSSQGEIGEHCYPNGTCNVTLACVGGVCVAAALDAGIDGAFDSMPDASPVDAPPDAPPDAYCDPISATPPVGHHNAGTGCMSAAQCHNQALGLGTGAPAYSYGGTLYKTDKTTPFAGATIVLKLGTAEKSVVVADNGNFWMVPGVAGLDPPTTILAATAKASGCPDVVPMVGTLTAGGGDCNKGGCHTPGVGQGVIHLP